MTDESTRVQVTRCPKCGSTRAGRDGFLSDWDYDRMHCHACGHGELVEVELRGADWTVEFALSPGAALPERLPLEVKAPSTPRVQGGDAALAPAVTPRVTPGPPPPSVLVEPTAPRGCARCGAADAPTAWRAARERKVENLVAEPHFGISVTACSCGQHFIEAFSEWVEFGGDRDDELSASVLPVHAAELASLRTLPGSQLTSALRKLGAARRWLVSWSPMDASRARWMKLNFAIGRHS
jgi:hypothetical protein